MVRTVMGKVVEVLPDKAALVQRALALVVDIVHGAIADRGRCTIALSGGSTPKPLYAALATQDISWDMLHIFWGDERYVPHDHPDSNYRMTREVWLEQAAIPSAVVHPMPTDLPSPEQAAEQYEADLRALFQVSAGVVPAFDIVLLGMGDDGHTASLFPHTPALTVYDRLVTVGNKDGQPRLTVTVPVINQARNVIFLVSGASKRPALAQVFADAGDADMYPARLVQPSGNLWWLLDTDAGGS